jgi:hypothetical protein
LSVGVWCGGKAAKPHPPIHQQAEILRRKKSIKKLKSG